MNIASLGVLYLLFVCVAWAVLHICRTHKKVEGPGCTGNCASCRGCK